MTGRPLRIALAVCRSPSSLLSIMATSCLIFRSSRMPASYFSPTLWKSRSSSAGSSRWIIPGKLGVVAVEPRDAFVFKERNQVRRGVDVTRLGLLHEPSYAAACRVDRIRFPRSMRFAFRSSEKRSGWHVRIRICNRTASFSSSLHTRDMRSASVETRTSSNTTNWRSFRARRGRSGSIGHQALA